MIKKSTHNVGNESSHHGLALLTIFNILTEMLKNKIYPVIIKDGAPPKMKAIVLEKRKLKRRLSISATEELASTLNSAPARRTTVIRDSEHTKRLRFTKPPTETKQVPTPILQPSSTEITPPPQSLTKLQSLTKPQSQRQPQSQPQSQSQPQPLPPPINQNISELVSIERKSITQKKESYIQKTGPVYLKKISVTVSEMNIITSTVNIHHKNFNQGVEHMIMCLGVPIIQAPAEAESQAAYLCKQKKVDAVLSRDYDTLAFGAPALYFPDKFDIKLMAVHELSKILYDLFPLYEEDKRMEKFIQMCVLGGSDFLNIEFPNNFELTIEDSYNAVMASDSLEAAVSNLRTTVGKKLPENDINWENLLKNAKIAAQQYNKPLVWDLNNEIKWGPTQWDKLMPILNKITEDEKLAPIDWEKLKALVINVPTTDESQLLKLSQNDLRELVNSYEGTPNISKLLKRSEIKSSDSKTSRNRHNKQKKD